MKLTLVALLLLVALVLGLGPDGPVHAEKPVEMAPCGLGCEVRPGTSH